MKYFCTLLDEQSLPRVLALHRSLRAHANGGEMIVLCLDEPTVTTLRRHNPPGMRLLTLEALLRPHPRLAAARMDRTASEFRLTCKSWLVHASLPEVPPGEWLTYVDASLYFFHSPKPVFEALDHASVAIVSRRHPAAWSILEQQGKYEPGWISLRHDPTGLRCAADWADRCAEWCYLHHMADRFAEQKYLDRWPHQFPGTHILATPGLNLCPGNLGTGTLSAGPCLNNEPIVCFNFSELTHLAHQLYDPCLHRYGQTLTPDLRRWIYQPYLRELHPGDGPDTPDVVPTDADNARNAEIVPLLLARLDVTRREQVASLHALSATRSEAEQTIAELRGQLAEASHYSRALEQDRDEQRASFFATKQRLEAAYLDLTRNAASLKKMEAEVSAQVQASVEREAYIASLNENLARPEVHTAAGPELAAVYPALAESSHSLRRIIVAHYHPRLLPMILCWASQGISVEVFSSPSELAQHSSGAAHFITHSLWDWLGGLNSLFSEASYRLANPDVADALDKGSIGSGWEHYLRFGQQEGRLTGTLDYRGGLPDTDAVAFDSSHAVDLLPCLIGRLQRHQRLYISSCFNPATTWLPATTPRVLVMGDLLCCPRPPTDWLGPCLPASLSTSLRLAPSLEEIYPTRPQQQAVWPRITVVTTSFNQAQHLEQTIRSVLDQNYPHLEYIIVDSGSHDNSTEIIQRYADRLVWWGSEPCPGLAQALNKGFAKSTGQILAWVQGADQLAPGSLFTVAQQFLLHDTDIVAGRCARVTGEASGHPTLHRSVLSLGRIQPLPLPALLDLDGSWLKDCLFDQPEVFFSRQIFERAGGKLSEHLTEGIAYDLWVRLAKANARILPVPEVLALFRLRPEAHPGSPESPHLSELRAINAAHQAATPVTS